MSDFRIIQLEVSEWHRKNFPDSTSEDMLIGVMEELGELAHANLKGRVLKRDLRDEERDAVGDVAIFLMEYCTKRGFNFCGIVSRVWEEVRKRDYTGEGRE